VVGINTLVATSTDENTASSIGIAIAANGVSTLLPALRAGG
jgi:S1-C subfamily serine protease